MLFIYFLVGLETSQIRHLIQLVLQDGFVFVFEPLTQTSDNQSVDINLIYKKEYFYIVYIPWNERFCLLDIFAA
jgi:hypothetical protein